MDTNKEVQARQGDIFFRVVSEIPAAVVKKNRKHGSNILAHGEVTGHTHKITSPISDCEVMLTDEEGNIFVRSSKEIVVEHDEHGTITLPANEDICISRQREYDPLAAEKERQVAD